MRISTKIRRGDRMIYPLLRLRHKSFGDTATFRVRVERCPYQLVLTTPLPILLRQWRGRAR